MSGDGRIAAFVFLIKILRYTGAMGIIGSIDAWLIGAFRRASIPVARIALFTVYFWFGLLKLLDVSPANSLVRGLLEQTLPFMTFETFIVLFALYEMLIGAAFLVRGWERFAIALMAPHMVMTALPLVLLPAVAWQGWFVPTLEGQYMIKNVALIALAMAIAGHLVPFRDRLHGR
jgi:uncharacterized membrane protein YkgB